MPSAPKKVDVSTAMPSLEGLQAKTLELTRPEDEDEKRLRLEKERVGFYVKELGTLVFAAVVVVVVVAFCSVFLFDTHSAPAEKEWARSVLMAVLTGAVGFAFGKATK